MQFTSDIPYSVLKFYISIGYRTFWYIFAALLYRTNLQLHELVSGIPARASVANIHGSDGSGAPGDPCVGPSLAHQWCEF